MRVCRLRPRPLILAPRMQVVVVVVAALAISGTREMRSPGGCLQDLGTLSGSSLQISKPPQLQAARDECRPAPHCRHCYYSYYYREEPEDAQTNRPYFLNSKCNMIPYRANHHHLCNKTNQTTKQTDGNNLHLQNLPTTLFSTTQLIPPRVLAYWPRDCLPKIKKQLMPPPTRNSSLVHTEFVRTQSVCNPKFR